VGKEILVPQSEFLVNLKILLPVHKSIGGNCKSKISKDTEGRGPDLC
jgi:hypothetical protein